MSLLKITSQGLYCEAGDFFIDPWKPVDFAVTTHAHSDHARSGSQFYLTADAGGGVLQQRLGSKAVIETLPYGRETTRNGVSISLHPAGHVLGSSQVRVEHRGEIWVVSGDYKTEVDATCAPFEPIRCHTFITESTFGLPIYQWRPQQEIFDDINAWWRGNQLANRTSVIFAYSLGKAQRIMGGVDSSIGPIFVHDTISKLLPHYAAAGIRLPEVTEGFKSGGQGLVIAPMSLIDTPWLRKFGENSKAFASGWMRLRGARRRQALDRGFALSDHADWDGLQASIRATGAERVWVTHGFIDPMVRWLRENGWDAAALKTRFVGEQSDSQDEPIATEP